MHKIQAAYKITPLSEWGKTPTPIEVKIDPTVDMKTPPLIQADTMAAAKYFTYAAELLKLHPPDQARFEAFNQKLNLRLLELFEAEGIKFA